MKTKKVNLKAGMLVYFDSDSIQLVRIKRIFRGAAIITNAEGQDFGVPITALSVLPAIFYKPAKEFYALPDSFTDYLRSCGAYGESAIANI